MLSNKSWKTLFIIYLFIIILIVVGAYQGLIPTEIDYIPFYDTVGHFVLLGLLSFLFHRALNKKHIENIPIAPVIIMILAIIEESFQIFSPIRVFSLFDLSSNILGIWLFYFFDRFILDGLNRTDIEHDRQNLN